MLRVAIWRDATERIFSSYRDKLTCRQSSIVARQAFLDETYRFFLESMMKLARLPAFDQARRPCISIDEFGDLIDALRKLIEAGEIQMEEIEEHFRPSRFYYTHIKYDVILETVKLNDAVKVAPIAERLKSPRSTASASASASAANMEYINLGPSKLRKRPQMNDSTAKKFALYAALSENVPPHLSHR